MIDISTTSQRFERFLAMAKELNLKLTHQRLEIFRALASREDHPGAEEIYKQLVKRLPTLSLDTVYRTLGLLRELGIISTLNPHTSVTRYDANHTQHHHFVCERCGAVQDYQNITYNAIPIAEDLSEMGEAHTLRVEIRGLCRNCLDKQDQPNKMNNHSKGDKDE
jgi:Fur family peroxide stress response transcriptional regulator